MSALPRLRYGLGVACAAAFSVQPAWATPLAEVDDIGTTVVRVAGAFLLCILAAFAGAVLLRRLYANSGPVGPSGSRLFPFLASLKLDAIAPSPPSQLSVHSRVQLTPGIYLCIVSFRAQEVLLCVTPQGVSVLSVEAAIKKDVL